MFEIFYKAKFCGGPLDGFVETQRAVNGILLDAIGRSHPGESGFEFARYVRDGFPDSDGCVKYVLDDTTSDQRNGSLDGREMEHQEPVAWAILHKDHQYVSLCREQAEAHNVYTDAEIVPLYAGPTLTDEERRAIRRAAAVADEMHDSRLKAALGGLLERLK